MAQQGTLFVVGTPLGNLEDMSPRAVRVLGSVALVMAEDTRSAQKLWARFGIAPKTLSCFEGNEAERAAELVTRLGAGEDVAYISEAGMPGVSDPGERLVRAAAEAGAPVVVVPGPSAAVTALAGSGLPTSRFTFVGFLPPREEERLTLLGRLRRAPETLLFYESPGRTGATLDELARTLGPDRRACLSRELTKIHEEYVRGTLAELATRYADEAPRGEVTLVVQGAPAGLPDEDSAPLDLEADIDARLRAGDSPKDIAAALAVRTGKPRRQLYQLALARKGRLEPRADATDASDDSDPSDGNQAD